MALVRDVWRLVSGEVNRWVNSKERKGWHRSERLGEDLILEVDSRAFEFRRAAGGERCRRTGRTGLT